MRTIPPSPHTSRAFLDVVGLFMLAFTFIPLPGHAQSSSLPFDRGVRIDVVAAKPAPVRGGDWDDKTQKITLRVKFSNQHNRQSYEGYTATISGLGQSAVDRDVRIVFLQEKVDLPLAPLKVHEHSCKEIVTRFDKTVAKFGYFYDGWIILVKDPAGKVVHVKSTSPSLEKLPDKVAKLAAGKCYDRNLEFVENGEPLIGR